MYKALLHLGKVGVSSYFCNYKLLNILLSKQLSNITSYIAL